MTDRRQRIGDDHRRRRQRPLHRRLGRHRFDLSAGGVDWAFGGYGNDRFAMGPNLFAADMIDGGKGFDTIVLNGDYAAGLIFAPKTMTNVEQLLLKPGHSYNLTPNEATVAAG